MMKRMTAAALWMLWIRMVRFMSELGRHEKGFLVSTVLIAGGIWLFAELADEVHEGNTGKFDTSVLLAMRNPDDPSDPIGPAWLEEFGRDMTALGGVGVLAMLTLAVTGYLVLQRKIHAAVVVLLSTCGALLISTALKAAFDRPRPDLVPHGSFVYTSSFPSGHSMLSAATYLTLAALLARVQSQRRIKAYLLLLAMMATVAVGVSRVYLGVHWPTDVLSGWTGGALWALVCWSVARQLQKRGQMETETAEPDPPETGPVRPDASSENAQL